MKKTAIACVMSLGLLAGCAEYPGSLGYGDGGNSLGSASSAGEYGWLWALLGVGILAVAVDGGLGSSSP